MTFVSFNSSKCGVILLLWWGIFCHGSKCDASSVFLLSSEHEERHGAHFLRHGDEPPTSNSRMVAVGRYEDEPLATLPAIQHVDDNKATEKRTSQNKVIAANREEGDDNESDNADFSFVAYPASNGAGNSRVHEPQEEITGDLRRQLADTTKPTIYVAGPASGAIVASVFEVQAIVKDNVEVKNVVLKLRSFATNSTSLYSRVSTGNDLWTRKVRMSHPGTVRMTLIAYDAVGNNASTTAVNITSDFIPATRWTDRKAPMSRAVGQIIYTYPDTGHEYYCTGTLVQMPPDLPEDRSIVMTAQDCTFDIRREFFARKALFIPQQDDGGSDTPDRNCTNDALGCLPLDFVFYAGEPPNVIFYVSKSTKTMFKNQTIGRHGQIVPMKVKFGPVTNRSKVFAMGYAWNSTVLSYMADIVQIDKYDDGSVFQYSLPIGDSITDAIDGGPWTADDPSKHDVVSVFAVGPDLSWGAPGVWGTPCHAAVVACIYDAAVSTNLSTIKTKGVDVRCFD